MRRGGGLGGTRSSYQFGAWIKRDAGVASNRRPYGYTGTGSTTKPVTMRFGAAEGEMSNVTLLGGYVGSGDHVTPALVVRSTMLLLPTAYALLTSIAPIALMALERLELPWRWIVSDVPLLSATIPP